MAKKSENSVVVGSDTSSLSDRHGLLKARLSLAKAWAEKPHKAWKELIREYEIDDVSETEEIRDKVRIGYIFRRIESDLPSIFDDQPDLFFKGKKSAVEVMEPLFESAYDWLWDIQNLEEVIEDAGLYFLLLGMGFVDSPWVTKTKKVPQEEQRPVIDGATGQPVIDPVTGTPVTRMEVVEYDVPIIDNPVAEVKDPFKLYFSPETKFATVLDYKHCPYYFEEQLMTVDEVEARFGKKVETSEKLKFDDDETLDASSKLKEYLDDIKRVTVYTYTGCLPKEAAEKIESSEAWRYDKEYKVYFTANEELKAEELPYDTKPLHVLGNYGLANKFWKFGDAKHLRPLVDELQAYRTQILRHTRKMANPKMMVPADTVDLDEKALENPNVGTIVKYNVGTSGQKIEYLSPSALGSEVATGVGLVRTDLEQTSGAFSLAQGSGVSTVKTPRGIQEYSEAADKNIRRKKKKVARFIRHLLLFQLKQLAQFWKPEDQRTLDIISDGEEESVPVTAEVLNVFGDTNMLAKLDIEVESLSVNKVQIKQDALELFDLAVKTPGVFNLDEMARDLLQNGYGKKDADRYLLTEEQKAQMANSNKESAKVSVSVKSDASTPVGAAILESSGVLPQGVGQEAAEATQIQELQKDTLIEASKPEPQLQIPAGGK